MGMSIAWTVANQPQLGERGQGSLTEAGKINATWTNASGGGEADGTVFALNSNGRAARITSSNGVLFVRGN